MRNNIFIKTAFFSIMSGFILGAVFSLYSTESDIDSFGAWLLSFYNGETFETWIKSAFSTFFFLLAVLLSGAFVFGYLLSLPINFHFGYTFGYLFSSSILCFGRSAVLNLALKVPTLFISAIILSAATADAMNFSLNLFSGYDYKTIRTKTAQYLTKCFIYTALSMLPLIYDAVIIPKILNLWVSF